MQLPRIIFGAMAHHGATTGEARVRTLRAAADLGYAAFDTAPLYGFGDSERCLGEALKPHPDAVVMSKVGLRWDADHGEILFATPERTVRKDSRPRSVLDEIDQSLERLGRDHIELVHLHHPDVHVPIGETMDALREALSAKKIGAIGVSNFSPEQLRAAAGALAPTPLFSVQDGYNLVERDAERQLLPMCAAADRAFLAFSPLAQGLLAGKLLDDPRIAEGDWRAHDPKFQPHNLRLIHDAIRTSLQPIARARGVSLAETALAWLLAEPGVTSVIAGARTLEHAESNLRAVRLSLTDTERAQLHRTFEAVKIQRARG
ncbi:MAG TPA: aldo/keto reductase, partial [Polyangiaceae bacterium]|nr:aldo/keto reductase [Polyangiaceae bacterium]